MGIYKNINKNWPLEKTAFFGNFLTPRPLKIKF